MNNDKQTARYKAREYMYDLNNVASENGFKADENWEVTISTAAEKKEIEKIYYPTVASGIVPELLNATFRLVKDLLNQQTKEVSVLPAERFSVQPEYQYIIAFNRNRLRR